MFEVWGHDFDMTSDFDWGSGQMFDVGDMISTSLHVLNGGSDQMFVVGAMNSTCLQMFDCMVSVKCIRIYHTQFGSLSPMQFSIC